MAAPKTRKRSGGTEKLLETPVGISQPLKDAPLMKEIEQIGTLGRKGLRWEGYEELGENKERVKDATREILQLQGEIDSTEESMAALYKMTVEKAIQIGGRLALVKDILPHGSFLPWVKAEFPFSHDTASNYMKLSKRYAGDEISKLSKLALPLSAFHALAGAPETAITEVTRRAEQGQSTSVDEAKKLSWRHRALEEAGVVAEARLQLGDAKIDDYSDMKWLGSLVPEDQLEAAGKIASKEAKTVRSAIRQLPAAKTVDIPPTVTVKFENQVNYTPGNWDKLIEQIEADSVDLIVLDAPSRQDYLETYGLLAEECARILKDKGVVLATVGHQALQQVGTVVKPHLNINWTLAVRKRPGDSKRMDWTGISTSWQPVCIWYKGKWNRPDGIIDDLRTYGEDAPKDDNGLKLLTVEDGIADYVERLIHSTQTLVHLVPEAKHSYNLAPKLDEIARSKNVGKLIGIGIQYPN